MKKHITWQEVSDLSITLQNEIISLLTTKDRKMSPMSSTITSDLIRGQKKW